MRRRTWLFVIGGLLISLLLAGVVSNFASPHPDGLDSALHQGCTLDAEGAIIAGSCPAQQTEEHELAQGPLVDYEIQGLDNSYLSTGLSGALGVLLTFALGAGLFWMVRRRQGDDPAAGDGQDQQQKTPPKPASA